jgi:hypothetical protein
MRISYSTLHTSTTVFCPLLQRFDLALAAAVVVVAVVVVLVRLACAWLADR